MNKSLRSLPPRDRAVALRLMLLAHFPDAPRCVGLPGQPGMPEAEAHEGPQRQRGYARVLALGLLAGLGIAGALVAMPAHAGTLRLDVNLASYHTERWAREALNQRNPGLGVTYQFDRTWALAGGVYSNSYRRPTAYVLAEWTPLQVGRVGGWHVDAGLAAGIATGYRRDEVATAPFAGGAIVRITAPAGVALNLVGVPNEDARHSGFVGFQLSFPLD